MTLNLAELTVEEQNIPFEERDLSTNPAFAEDFPTIIVNNHIFSDFGAKLEKSSFVSIRRREWDSNPRWGLPHSGFQDRRLRPLGHPSENNITRARTSCQCRNFALNPPLLT